jgi:hypothetical protein
MALILETDENLNNLFNIGIKSFGYKNVIDIINSFYNQYNLPIVSIGSGIGAIEYFAKKNNNKIEWVCIDNQENPIDFPPSAKIYIDKPLMKIDNLSIDKLIETNPSIVNNCIIFLNWCLPNDSYYDFEAIIKLKPLAILSIYEDFNGISGAAGGEMFYNWTKNNTDYHLKEEYTLYADKYHADDDEIMDIRIGWWQSNTFDVDDLIIKGFPCVYNGNHKSQCCIQ